jgi:RND family efflux transporter MFP subunit
MVLALVGAFAGFRVWKAYEKKNAASTPAAGGSAGAGRVITVSTARARMVPVSENLAVTGFLKPKEQVDVMSKVTGRVERLAVQAGDAVRAGQLLAELEDSELAQQVRRAEAARDVVRATVQQRNAELANAKADADRAKQLLDQGLIAKQDHEAKLTAFRVMQAQMALATAQTEQASAELRELMIQQEQMKITAPLSGFVAQRFVDSGALVSPSTPIVRLVNLSTMVTVANVPEKDIAKLRVGNRATVVVDAFGRSEFEGRVARIVPVLDPATRTALVEVEIPNASGALKAEMSARVKLDLATSRQAVVVPRDSLVYRGQQAGVFVLAGKKPVFHAVETGTASEAGVEVIANLAAGTTVVNRGAAMLQEGDEVRVVGAEDAELSAPEAPREPSNARSAS